MPLPRCLMLLQEAAKLASQPLRVINNVMDDIMLSLDPLALTNYLGRGKRGTIVVGVALSQLY